MRVPDWNNDGIPSAGAVTWGSGSRGIIGQIDSSNSILGTVTNLGYTMNVTDDTANQRIFVGRPAENIITILLLGIPTALDDTQEPSTSERIYLPFTNR